MLGQGVGGLGGAVAEGGIDVEGVALHVGLRRGGLGLGGDMGVDLVLGLGLGNGGHQQAGDKQATRNFLHSGKFTALPRNKLKNVCQRLPNG